MAVSWIVYLIVGIFVVLLLGAMFYASRYRKFDTSLYVIHFRGGKVIKAGQGGKAIVIPLIDEVKVIPVTTQSTFLEAKEKVVSRDFKKSQLPLLCSGELWILKLHLLE